MTRNVRQRRLALCKAVVLVNLAEQPLRAGLMPIGVEHEVPGVPSTPCGPAKVQPVMMRARDVTSSWV